MARHQKQTDRSNIDEDCLSRLNKIHTLIKTASLSQNVISLVEIQNSLPVNKKTNEPISRATIYRDLALLGSKKEDDETGGFGAPIKFDRVKGGYYYTDVSYNFNEETSSSENLVSLVLAKNLLSGLSSESPVYKKISKLTKDISSTEELKLTERIAIAPRMRKTIEESLWNSISTALAENRNLNLKVKYFGMNKTYMLNYNFSPYQLIYDEGTYFLWGKENLDDGFRIKSPRILLSLNDIDSGELTDEHFELPEDFRYQKETEKYKIKLFSIARNEIVNCAFATNQEVIERNEDEGSVVVAFESSEFLLVHNWILGLGANVIPLEPQDLVDAWENEIYCMIKSSGIDVDWILLNEKRSRKILDNEEKILRKRYMKRKQIMQEDSKNTYANQAYEYLALLLKIRTHISYEYLKEMSARDLFGYIESLLPSVSKIEFHALAKKAGLFKTIETVNNSKEELFSKNLSDIIKLQDNID